MAANNLKILIVTDQAPPEGKGAIRLVGSNNTKNSIVTEAKISHYFDAKSEIFNCHGTAM